MLFGGFHGDVSVLLPLGSVTTSAPLLVCLYRSAINVVGD